MPSQTILSDAVVVAPRSATILSDATVVPPISSTINSDVVFVPPVSSTIKSDVFFVPSTSHSITSDVFFEGPAIPQFIGGDGSGELCMPYLAPLVEGVDYELDAENGLVKFLSSGVLGGLVNNLYSGLCGVSVDACCQESSCSEISDVNGACDGACYVRDGYDTVFQEGAESYRTHDEKTVKRITVEAEPLPQSTQSPLECDIGFASQPNCFTWKEIRPLDFECQTQKSQAQHAADHTRPDDGFHFPTWRRGRYLSARFRVTGIGGGGEFSALHKMVQHWGQKESP